MTNYKWTTDNIFEQATDFGTVRQTNQAQNVKKSIWKQSFAQCMNWIHTKNASNWNFRQSISFFSTFVCLFVFFSCLIPWEDLICIWHDDNSQRLILISGWKVNSAENVCRYRWTVSSSTQNSDQPLFVNRKCCQFICWKIPFMKEKKHLIALTLSHLNETNKKQMSNANWHWDDFVSKSQHETKAVRVLIGW